MPRPVFDINEYELRGLVPDVFTEEQKALLNTTLSRANGQIDWTAQLLGYNGPKYWGRPNLKKDGTYNWVGLPETMNEKRQLQAGTFGVFNKDKDYSEWPAPFNRSEIKASGDAYIHVWVKDGKTQLGPLGQLEITDYNHNPAFFVGSTYIFDQRVEFTCGGSDPGQVIWTTTFYENDQVWTRLKVKQSNTVIGVKPYKSDNSEAFVDVLEWTDSSDWNYSQVVSNFLGAWGNKGSSISFDVQFDALDIHGFNESYGLTLGDVVQPFTLTQLLAKVGLEPTEWTPYWNTKFGFKVGDCVPAYPLPPFESGDLYNNEFYDRTVEAGDDYLTDGTFESPAPIESVVEEGIYERVFVEVPSGNFDFFTCESDCYYEMTLSQQLNDEVVQGIGSITFEYESKADCGLIDFPCVEWVFDPTLDNGTLEDTIVFPTALGPWATANDGIYESPQPCFEGVDQGEAACEGAVWCGFDDGEFDERVEPNCGPDPEEVVQGCLEVDGGFYTAFGPPDYDACKCAEECCEVNNGIYVYGESPYLGPELADGGEVVGQCVIYDHGEYDITTEDYSCDLDNGTMSAASPPTTIADSRLYDRTYTDCAECGSSSTDEPIPCPVDFVYVALQEMFDDVTWSMRPTIRNSVVPLRLWKSRPLSCVDAVPPVGDTQHNYLVADQNQGPDEQGAYRHFARLPLEYARNGKFWNRTQAVCDNMSYFSAPPKLSETRARPQSLRPLLYEETYFESRIPDYKLFYSEPFLTSINREDSENVQEGFEGSQVSFETDGNIPFAFAVIEDYDALASRIPYENGEWRGDYYTTGTGKVRTGFVLTDVESQNLSVVPDIEDPTYDMSQLKLPETEFPDSEDKAAMKNYVVSYAYFASDFSAADDPVFDPAIEHCWRDETITCSTPQGDDCLVTERPTNTAYLLHSPN